MPSRAPALKRASCHATRSSPVVGSTAVEGTTSPARIRCPVFGSTAPRERSRSTLTGGDHVVPASLDRIATTSNSGAGRLALVIRTNTFTSVPSGRITI